MKKTILVFIIFISSSNILLYAEEVSTYKVYDSFFISLKSLEYDSITIPSENSETEEVLQKLVDILYYGDQKKEKNDNLYPINSDTTFTNAVRYLANGYSELYSNSIDSKSYIYFSNGYTIAKKLNYKPLQKQFLLGILELYHWEILQSNVLYEKYLQDFENIATDPLDFFWIEIYEVILGSKNILAIQKLSSDKLLKLDKVIVTHKIKNQNILTKYYYEKAIHFGFDQNYLEAKKYYKKVIPHAKTLPFMYYMVFGCYIRLSAIYSKKNQTSIALIQLDSAKKYISPTNTLRSILFIDRSISKYHQKLKQYDSAYYYLEKSLETEYKLKHSENSIEISRLNKKYESVEKEKKIVQLLNTNLKSEANRVRNRNLFIGAIFFIAIGLLIALLLYKNIKRKQRIAEQEHEIELQKTEKLLKEQELSAIDAMILGQEKERQRLANDLHDNLGSTLATVKLHFQHLRNNKNNPKIQNIEELYSKTDTLLEEAYQKVRTIAHEKNSGVMANQGLLLAIKNLAKKVSNGNLLVEVQDYGLEQRLDNALEITIFRMIQELITNAIKHAKATEIQISLTNHDSLLNIIVEDNGKGFDAKVLPKKEGMGLATIEKRVEHLEGTFEIDSTIGKGTNIIINIPI